MTAETAHPLPARRLPRWSIAAAYLAVIAVAEVLIAVPGPASDPNAGPFQELGLTLHILVVFALLFHAVLAQDRDRVLSYLLVALSLAPLIRIFSLSVPHYPPAPPGDPDLYILDYLGLVSLPLLSAVGAVIYVQGLRLSDLGLGLHDLGEIALQVAIGLSGLGLGLVEYAILRPAEWDYRVVPGGFPMAIVIIVLATGLSEELIFRGVLLRRAIEGLGRGPGVLFVTLVFASLHAYFRNPTDMVFVFGVGLFFAVAVLRTKSLWGAIMSHSLGNVVLYLVAPLLFAR